MPITSTTEGKRTTIMLGEKFNFSEHSAFRQAYENDASQNTFIVDFVNTKYLDSSALGMLLLLREHADKDKGHVILKNANKDVSNILSIAKFDKLFTIES